MTQVNVLSKLEVWDQLEVLGGMYRVEEKCHIWLENKGPITQA